MPSTPAGTVTASHFSRDTLEFIRLLDQHAVRYVVVGGEAVIYHGYARFTGDVDFFYSNGRNNVRKLFAALEEFWAGNIPGLESSEELEEPGIVVQFGRPPNRIDLVNRIDGVGFEAAWKTKLLLRIARFGGDIPLFMLDLDNLLRNKRAAGRAKDLEDFNYLKRAAQRKRSRAAA